MNEDVSKIPDILGAWEGKLAALSPPRSPISPLMRLAKQLLSLLLSLQHVFK